MSEPRAQRTLVKSPPELWAEVSDAEALARHLGVFGEIRITRLKPETTVAWEGDTARGTVELSASGWGTKVTLTATPTEKPTPPAGRDEAHVPDPRPSRVIPASPAARSKPADAEYLASAGQKVRDRYMGPADVAMPAPADRVPFDARAPRIAPAPVQEATPDPPTPATPAQLDSEPAPEPRRFMARLRTWFLGDPPSAGPPGAPAAEVPPTAAPAPALQPEQGRDAGTAATRAPEVQPAVTAAPKAQPAVSAAPEVEPVVTAAPGVQPAVSAAPEAQFAVGASSEPAAREDEIVGILTGVLDELGFAHHRPFSRG